MHFQLGEAVVRPFSVITNLRVECGPSFEALLSAVQCPHLEAALVRVPGSELHAALAALAAPRPLPLVGLPVEGVVGPVEHGAQAVGEPLHQVPAVLPLLVLHPGLSG